MSTTATDQPSARLFFALDPPDSMRASLLDWQRRQITDPALRPVQPVALHTTLCFLGSKPESVIPALAAELRAELAEPVELTLEPDPVGRPAGRPRVFALAARSAAAVRLQERLQRALSSTGLHEPDERPFWPHITVARVRMEAGRKRRPQRVQTPPRPLPAALLSPFHAVRVALYRSYLRPSGSHYVSLASLELPHPVQTGAEKR